MPFSDLGKQRAYQREWMRRRRADALAGKSCVFCGSSDRLEFHHWDPAAKTDHNVWSWSAERREAELAKCVVLCHDCHVGRHREARPNVCSRGHELTPQNSYVKPGTGYRECRECRALNRRKAA